MPAASTNRMPKTVLRSLAREISRISTSHPLLLVEYDKIGICDRIAIIVHLGITIVIVEFRSLPTLRETAIPAYLTQHLSQASQLTPSFGAVNLQAPAIRMAAVA